MGVVIDHPFVGGPPSVGQAAEPMLVQPFVPELAVESLDEGILNGLARFSKVQPDTIVTSSIHPGSCCSTPGRCRRR